MPFFKRLSSVFGGSKKMYNASVLDLRSVVVASSIDEVYHIKRRLGEGQTAIVYEGIRHGDGKTYALKAFKINDTMRDTCEGLREEVEVLRALPLHKGVCQMVECVATPGMVYLTIELVAGGDLLSPIEESGAYSESTALALFAQMVDAVDTLHQGGIVHRDLKPENICFTTAALEWVKLIDLGAAGFLERDGMTDLCGTPLYAAPEVTPWFRVATEP